MMFFVLLALFSLSAFALSAGTVQGYVFSSADGSPLVGASVTVAGRYDAGGECDEKGFFSFSAPDGEQTLVCEYLGYEKQQRPLKVRPGAKNRLNFYLQTNVEELGTVEITSRAAHTASEEVQMSVSHLEVEDLRKMPAMMGEQDVVKSLQLMPGVKSESDGSSGFQVRGGESGQNLVLLDGATVNNAGHIMGLFPIFNSDFLRSVTLYKGQMPAQFGGRVASVLDIQTVPGDNQAFSADGSLGLLASKLTLQGPIQKGRSSFIVGARRTYLDMFLKLKDDMKDTKLYFYDLNAKLSFRLSSHNMLDVSLFNALDRMALNDVADVRWGNSAFNLRWFHTFASEAVLRSQVYHTIYSTTDGVDMLESDYSYKSHLYQTSLEEALSLPLGSRSHLELGFLSSRFDAVSAEWWVIDEHERERRYAWQNNVWLGDELQLSKRLSILAGLRLDVFSVLGGSPYYQLNGKGDIVSSKDYSSSSVVKNYTGLEPRLSASYKLSSSESVKAAYCRSSQNIHMVKNGIASMPIDRFMLSTNIFGPEKCDQFSLGYARSFSDAKTGAKAAWEVEAEAYFKHTDNILDYRDGASSFDYVEMDRLLLSGQGRSYGLELVARRNVGKLSGWVSYTLSRTESQVDGINHGRWYTAGSDRTHDASVVLIYSAPKRWSLSAQWVYTSGQAMSLPVAKYMVDGQTVFYYNNRNNYRAPSYHRLDLSATHQCRPHRHWQGEWVFGLFNAYGRYNPFLIHVSEDRDEDTGRITGTKLRQTSMFSFLPSVTYRFKFK